MIEVSLPQNLSFTISYFEIFLFIIIFILVGVINYLNNSNKRSVSSRIKNFLDELPFENNPQLLADKILVSICKKFNFTVCSYILINQNEPFIKNVLSEPVPDLYLEDVRNKFLLSLLESGIERKIESKKFNIVNDGTVDSKQKKVLVDFIHVPILINDVLIGMFSFSSKNYININDVDLLEIFEGISAKYESLSRYEEELKEDKDTFEDLINSMNSPVCMIGKNFELIYLNPSFQDLFKLNLFILLN